jgi:uncharacterized cupredoxin-like copper-binding protein
MKMIVMRPESAFLAVLAATAAGLAASQGLVAAALAHDTHANHDTHTYSAGEPGNPKRSARVVMITMTEKDDRMLFIPERIEVKRGEQIRFRLQNVGRLEHEFILASTEDNLKHAAAMKKHPDMEHEEPNGRRVEPGKKDDLVWRFTKRGTFEYGCLIPGHREAGMTGTVVVK